MMKDIKARLQGIDWERVAGDMNKEGYAHIPDMLTKRECLSLIGLYEEEGLYRKTIIMERYRFGAGEYKYFQYPLPPLIQQIRETVYPHLSPIANGWMKALNIDTRFPVTLEALRATCQAHQQVKPTVLILQYGVGGFNTLHQDLYGDVY